ncbi:MAG: hypothetical protein LBG64_00900 [Pseudomonadales bacterium]|jgi:hypothetical protein|nr:hypothetical protein [Pseudomonadales bacterium]
MIKIKVICDICRKEQETPPHNKNGDEFDYPKGNIFLKLNKYVFGKRYPKWEISRWGSDRCPDCIKAIADAEKMARDEVVEERRKVKND